MFSLCLKRKTADAERKNPNVLKITWKIMLFFLQCTIVQNQNLSRIKKKLAVEPIRNNNLFDQNTIIKWLFFWRT